MVRELDIGGCERDLAKMALHLDRTRFDPHVACYIDTGLRARELRDAGIPVLRLPVRSLMSFSLFEGAAAMRRYIREHGIRLVHAFDIPTDLFGIPVARLCGIPAIASQLSFRHVYTRTGRLLMAGIDRLADRVVVNSHAVAQRLIEDSKIPAEQVYVSHNGVDTREFYPFDAPCPEPLAGASLVIGAVCALRAEKGLDLLVRAFARVRDLDAGMKLAIVGSGVELSALQNLARELGVLNACVFVPATPEVAPWMRAMDVFVLTSHYESFPNALLEAMACGCAPVASSVGGVPELIAAGRTGLLFNMGDLEGLAGSLELLIRNPDIRRTLARNAAASARDEFSIERNVLRAEKLYESLLAGEGSTQKVPRHADVNP